MRHALSPAFLPRSSQGRGAFSLLEVAIALVIFVIGAIALLRIFPSGLNVLENSANRRVAAQMSQNVLTSYNSGDLTQTTPDAVYDFDDATGMWRDYPASALGLRRQAGTVPIGPDDFSSAKDSLKFINGEKQGVSRGVAYTNHLVDRRVNVSREGVIDGVRIDRTSGKLDFRNARYLVSRRPSVDSQPRESRLVCREPILVVGSVTSMMSNSLSYSAYSPRLDMSYKDQGDTFTIVLNRDYTPATLSPSLATLTPTVTWAGGGGAPAGITESVTNTADTITVTVTVAASATPGGQTSFKLDFGASAPDGLSLNSRSVLFVLQDTRGGAQNIQPQDPILPVLAPKQLRGADVTYYVSSTWNGGLGGAHDQPMTIPSADASYPAVPSTTLFPPDENLTAPLRFRQSFGNAPVAPDRVTVGLIGSFDDVDASVPISTLSQVALNYNVRSWEFISEDVSQFGTPFSGADNSKFINVNTAEGLVQADLLQRANYPNTNQIPASEVREARTRVGDVRGVVLVKGFYNQSAEPLDVAEFDTNSSTLPTGITSTVSPQDYVRQKRALAKQGRVFLPATATIGGNQFSLSRARIYYRSKDAWVQQVGVTAPHYLPASIGAISTPREQWREYVKGNDNVLYFRATEAGKTVEVLHGATLATATISTIEIRPDVLIDSSSAPAGFAAPVNGKTHVAYSRGRITDTIFDVRRPTGTSGISVRTMWLDGTRYAQEIAQ